MILHGAPQHPKCEKSFDTISSLIFTNITIRILYFSLSFLLELLILIVFVKICLLLSLVVLFLLSFCYCPKSKRARTRGVTSRGAYAPDESNHPFPPPAFSEYAHDEI